MLESQYGVGVVGFLPEGKDAAQTMFQKLKTHIVFSWIILNK